VACLYNKKLEKINNHFILHFMSFEAGFTHEPLKEEPTKDERITAKVGAIKNQSPDMSDTEVRSQAKDEVDRGLEIWGAMDVGPKWYSIEGESKETMEKWKAQIEEVLKEVNQAGETGDFSGLSEILGENFYESDLGKLFDKIKAEANEYGQEFDEEAKKLSSIGLWLWREQGGAWAGERKTVWKVLTKDSAKISSFLEEEGAPSCVDTSFLVKALADQLGIQGEVKKVERGVMAKATFGKMAHRYFQSDTGKVLDYWWSRGTAGLKMNSEAFAEVEEQRVGGSLCGT
jgi:hypothetical protein